MDSSNSPFVILPEIKVGTLAELRQNPEQEAHDLADMMAQIIGTLINRMRPLMTYLATPHEATDVDVNTCHDKGGDITKLTPKPKLFSVMALGIQTNGTTSTILVDKDAQLIIGEHCNRCGCFHDLTLARISDDLANEDLNAFIVKMLEAIERAEQRKRENLAALTAEREKWQQVAAVLTAK